MSITLLLIAASIAGISAVAVMTSTVRAEPALAGQTSEVRQFPGSHEFLGKARVEPVQAKENKLANLRVFVSLASRKQPP